MNLIASVVVEIMWLALDNCFIPQSKQAVLTQHHEMVRRKPESLRANRPGKAQQQTNVVTGTARTERA